MEIPTPDAAPTTEIVRLTLAFGDTDVAIPPEGDPQRQAFLEAVRQLETQGTPIRHREEGERQLVRALVSRVHLTCVFPSGKVDTALERLLRDELLGLYEGTPGFLRWDIGSGGQRPGPDTNVVFTATWATGEQAYQTLERARGWLDSHQAELGMATARITLGYAEPAMSKQ